MLSTQLLEHHPCSLAQLVCLTGSWELGAEADPQRKDSKDIPPYIYQRNGPRDKELYQAWFTQNASL